LEDGDSEGWDKVDWLDDDVSAGGGWASWAKSEVTTNAVIAQERRMTDRYVFMRMEVLKVQMKNDG
jgi:hypothetical protein